MKKLKFFLSLVFIFQIASSFAISPECDGQFSHKIEGVIPFARGFEGTIRSGSLTSRMEEFQARWPNNIKKVKNVKMKVDLMDSGSASRDQDMIVISFKDLSEAKQTELMEDYLSSIAENTLSFPLGRGAGHLYTRVGKKTLDNLAGVHVKDYRLPSYEDRLETVISLNEKEMDNLRWYTEHASTNSEKTVGKWDYEGTQETVGKLNDNQCAVGKGHNCTSWMGYAPLGENGEPLKEMIGAFGWDIARNPGWMTAYIHAYTPKSRFPFAVFMSNKSMTEIDSILESGKEFQWDYNLH